MDRFEEEKRQKEMRKRTTTRYVKRVEDKTFAWHLEVEMIPKFDGIRDRELYTNTHILHAFAFVYFPPCLRK